MTLTDVELIAGTLSVIYVLITSFVGAKIAIKYFEVKERVFLLVGIAWFGICSPWWPSSVSFLIALSTGGSGLYTTPSIYFIIGNAFIPMFIMLWMTAVTDLLYKDKQKLILIVYGIYGILFEIGFFYMLLFGNVSESIGVLHGPVDVDYKALVLVYLLTMIATIFITGILFGRASLKSNSPEIQLKGKLMIIAVLLWSVGAILDSAVPLDTVTVVIFRGVLITSAILFYGGFILPSWMKKLLLKEK